MPHTYSNLLFHIVFSTKDRFPFINPEFEERLHEYIGGTTFVAGFQPESKWLDDAAAKGWITQRPELNQQVMRNYTQNFDASATIEPFQDFRVELNANRQYARNGTELFKDQNFLLDPNEVGFEHRAAGDMGSFTVSYFTMKTLFNNDINGIFARYKDYRAVISNRLGREGRNINPHIKDGYAYTYGYGKIQQEVLIPAFIAAYSKADPNTVGLDIFKTRPAINWKLTYNGLAKIGNLNKIFSSIQIIHGYKNTLTVNSNERDEWELTDAGKAWAEAMPFSRNGHSGYQILWKPAVVDQLKEVA